METKSVIGGKFDIDQSSLGNKSNPCLQVKSHYTYSSGRASEYFFCEDSISPGLFMFYYH